jgi:hypothetical protein
LDQDSTKQCETILNIVDEFNLLNPDQTEEKAKECLSLHQEKFTQIKQE